MTLVCFIQQFLEQLNVFYSKQNQLFIYKPGGSIHIAMSLVQKTNYHNLAKNNEIIGFVGANKNLDCLIEWVN